MALAKFTDGAAFGDKALNEWKSGFHSENGYAVPNRFECLILPPLNVTFNNAGAFESSVSYSDPWLQSNDARAVSMRCESTTMPGRNLAAMDDTNIYGPSREIVNGVTYAGDVEMMFQASSGLEERVFFEEWQALAFDERSWNIKYYDDYVSDIDIYILDRQDTQRFGVKLKEAFPKTIGPTDLNQSPSNEIIKTSVSFSFRYWETLDINRQPSRPT